MERRKFILRYVFLITIVDINKVFNLRHLGKGAADTVFLSSGFILALLTYDQTVSALNSFFLALSLHPHVLKKAQMEIDAVVGNERLPTYSDRTSLPYVNALALEVLRWHTVVPTGKFFKKSFSSGWMTNNGVAVPHRVMQDDVHDGYFIPKGALVIPNIW